MASRPLEESRVDVAPAWMLMWWRFRKHRLALVASGVLAVIVVMALFAEFFSTQSPHATAARNAYIPPQGITFYQGRLAIKTIEGKRNPRTLRMEWTVSADSKVPIGFFVKGFRYKLLGLIPTDRHLLGPVGESGEPQFHILGTDRLGRDQWSRLMYASRISLSIGLLAVTVSVFLGVLLGGISGYFGGPIDLLIQRLIELLQALPAIPVWLALSAALPRTWPVEWVYLAITVILALIGWTQLGREVRGRFLSLREEDFVTAARLIGCSRGRIIFRHMLPSFSSHIIASTTLAIPIMIINETFLSFLGLGLRPPAISWGVLLQEAQNLQSVVNAPWLLIPGFAVLVTVLALNILGDGIRDAADPYSA